MQQNPSESDDSGSHTTGRKRVCFQEMLYLMCFLENYILTFFRFVFCIVVHRHWLTARSEQVMAKGKGSMQTYWCDPSSVSTDSDKIGQPSTVASSVTGNEICYEI
jgi:hypothetical protein